MDVVADHWSGALYWFENISKNVKINFTDCDRRRGNGSFLDVAAWNASFEVAVLPKGK